MAAVRHRFATLLAVFAVAVAHLACACSSAHAGGLSSDPVVRSDASAAGHACCNHASPGRPEPASERQHDGGGNVPCQHCDGLYAAALSGSDPAHASAGGHLESAATTGGPAGPPGSAIPSAVAFDAATRDASLSPRPTLLRLRCALNL